MSGRLNGKVAAITGTGGGQGRAAALLFAQEGAAVAGCDLDAPRAQETLDLVRAQGGKMISVHPLDLNDRDTVKAWLEDIEATFGGIDILYNNASSPRFAPIATMQPEDWHYTVRNELDIIFHVTQLAWPYLVARGGGAIVNTASVSALRAHPKIPGGVAHAATKAGVIGMTREFAVEGGKHNIRANSISPGLIPRPGHGELFDGLIEQTISRQIIKRIGQPQDIANAALFLCSDESSFITAIDLVVDGGYVAT